MSSNPGVRADVPDDAEIDEDGNPDVEWYQLPDWLYVDEDGVPGDRFVGDGLESVGLGAQADGDDANAEDGAEGEGS